jgi:hypothetical protein
MPAPIDGLGDSDVVPALLDELEQCPKKSRVAQICVVLGEERLVHQGAWSAAAPTIIPRLIALLETSEAKERILLVLARLAAGEPEPHWQRLVGGNEALTSLDARGDVASACRRAIFSAIATLRVQLESKRAIVRAATTLLLALFAPDAGTAAAITARFKKEKDDKARGALYLCLSSWQRAFGFGLDRTLLSAPEGGPFADLCRAAAMAWVPALRGEAPVQLLADAFLAPPAGFDPQKDLPLETRQLAFAALCVAHPDRAREVGLEGVRRETVWPRDLVSLFVPLPAQTGAWADLPLSYELPLKERAFLQALVEATPLQSKGGPWLSLAQAQASGFPSHTPDARRWLGIDPPSTWELPLAGDVNGTRVVWPVARWYRRLALGAIAREALFDALRLHPSAEEAVRIAIDANVGHVYDLFYVGKQWTWVESVGFAVDVLGARKDTEPTLLACLTHVTKGWDPLIVVTALARVMAPRELPEAADRLFSKVCDSFSQLSSLMREALLALPAPRRDAIILSLPLPAPLSGDSNVWNVRVAARLFAWAFLDLVTDRKAAVQKLVSAVAQWSPPPPFAHQGRLPDEEARVLFAWFGAAARDAIESALPTATATGRAALESALLVQSSES